jgi:hypothetical protein
MNPQSGESIGNFRGAILDAFVIPHNSLDTKALISSLMLLSRSPKLNVVEVDSAAREVPEAPVDPEV